MSLACVRGIHRGPVNSPDKWPVTRKMLPFDDVTLHMYASIFRVNIGTAIVLSPLMEYSWFIGFLSTDTFHRRNHGGYGSFDVVGLPYFLVDVGHFSRHWRLPCMFRRKTAHHLRVSTRKSRNGYRTSGDFINGDLFLGRDLAGISGGSVRSWTSVVCCHGGNDGWLLGGDVFISTRPLSIETD